MDVSPSRSIQLTASQQAAVEREKRRMAFIVIGVLVVIAAIVGLLIALGT